MTGTISGSCITGGFSSSGGVSPVGVQHVKINTIAFINSETFIGGFYIFLVDVPPIPKKKRIYRIEPTKIKIGDYYVSVRIISRTEEL